MSSSKTSLQTVGYRGLDCLKFPEDMVPTVPKSNTPDVISTRAYKDLYLTYADEGVTGTTDGKFPLREMSADLSAYPSVSKGSFISSSEVAGDIASEAHDPLCHTANSTPHSDKDPQVTGRAVTDRGSAWTSTVAGDGRRVYRHDQKRKLPATGMGNSAPVGKDLTQSRSSNKPQLPLNSMTSNGMKVIPKPGESDYRERSPEANSYRMNSQELGLQGLQASHKCNLTQEPLPSTDRLPRLQFTTQALVGERGCQVTTAHAPNISAINSLASSMVVGKEDLMLSPHIPPQDQVRDRSFPGVSYPNVTSQQRTAVASQSSTNANRGRPRKPQLPRPGQPGFIGPLNRRGRKSTGEHNSSSKRTKGVKTMTRCTDNGDKGQKASQDTPSQDAKRKRRLSDRPQVTSSSVGSTDVVPILLQLPDGHKAHRKVLVQYWYPTVKTDIPSHDVQHTRELDCSGMSRRRVNALIALFEDLVYPFVQSLVNHYKDFYADVDIKIIGLDVALEIVTVTLPDLIRVRRDPTTHQQTVIKRYTKELFCRKIQAYSKKHGSTPATPSGFSSLPLYKAEESPYCESTRDDAGNLQQGSSDLSFNLTPDVALLSENLRGKPAPRDPQRVYVSSVLVGAETTRSSSRKLSYFHHDSEHKSPVVAASDVDHRQTRSLSSCQIAENQNDRNDAPATNVSSFTLGMKTEIEDGSASLQDPTRKPTSAGVTKSTDKNLHDGSGYSAINDCNVDIRSDPERSPSFSRNGAQLKETHNKSVQLLDSASNFAESIDPTPRDKHKIHQALGLYDKDSFAQTQPCDTDLEIRDSGDCENNHSVSTAIKTVPESSSGPSFKCRNPIASAKIPSGYKGLTELRPNGLQDAGRCAGSTSTYAKSTYSARAGSRFEIEAPGVITGTPRPIFDPSLVLVAANVNSTLTANRCPYKTISRMRAKVTDQHNTVKHVDFTDLECEAIYAAMQEIYGPLDGDYNFPSTREKLRKKLKDCKNCDFDAIARLAHSRFGLQQRRKRKVVRKFLCKLADQAPTVPSIIRAEQNVIEPDPNPKIASLLRDRELGTAGRAQQDLRHVFIDKLSLVRSWKGASGDVICAAWHPDSQTYTVGATATANDEDLQYNRPNNLLHGDINRNTLRELPDHNVPRPKPNMISSGPNSSEAVYDACDPTVYRTVTAIDFSPEGYQFYSASHDGTVKVWDAKQTIPVCIGTLPHIARVTALEASKCLPQTFATASHTLEGSIRVYARLSSNDTYDHIKLDSSRARQKPQHEIFPECIRWGLSPFTKHLLLVGFTRWGELADYNPAKEGDLCLWDVATAEKLKIMPAAQNIYTAAFHPFLDAFSTGGAPGLKLTHQYTTRSVVRTWDRRSGSPHSMFEYECPALDMQDLVFHPRNANILAVGCTDGSVYIWDARNPDHPLQHFEHDEPIAEWDHKYGHAPMSREQGDGGVNMTLWGAGKHHLYTGATDGVIKCWDIDRAPEDALLRDVANLHAGVSCGSFSPDYSSLLVGDSVGGVHILSSDSGVAGGLKSSSKPATQPIEYIQAVRDKPSAPIGNQPQPGQLAAQEYLATGQLVVDPEFGVGKGPAYVGPFAAYAHEEGNLGSTRLVHDVEKAQPVSREGVVRDNAATRNIKAMIARRREERDKDLPRAGIIDLTSDTDEVAFNKKSPRGDVWVNHLDMDEVEEDHWFPRMDEEVFAKLQEKFA